MSGITVRTAGPDDRATITRQLTAAWTSTDMIVHGVVYDTSRLPALLAERDGQIVGSLVYTLNDQTGMEVVSLEAADRYAGAGTALLAAAAQIAREAGVGRIWLVTTNDNLDALRFYQRRGLRIVGVSPGAVDASRAPSSRRFRSSATTGSNCTTRSRWNCACPARQTGLRRTKGLKD